MPPVKQLAPWALLAGVCIAVAALVVVGLLSPTSTREDLGRILERDAVVAAIESTGIPHKVSEADFADSALVSEYDEFTDQSTHSATIALSEADGFVILTHSHEGRASPLEDTSISISWTSTFRDRSYEDPSLYLIVDGVRFQLLPDESAVGGFMQFEERSGDLWFYSLHATVGPNLIEWIGRSRSARVKHMGREYRVSTQMKATMLHLVRLAK